MPRRIDNAVRARNRKIEQQVKRFNAKITRESKNNPLAEFLPKKLSVTEVKQRYVTGRDVAQLVREVDRLFVRNALQVIQTPGGVITTKYELHEVELGVKRINAARKREMMQLQPSPFRGTMGAVRTNNLLPKRTDVENVKVRDWDKFVESVNKQALPSYGEVKQQQYKQNYLKGIIEEYGIDSKIYRLVSKLSPAQIVEAAFQNQLLTINAYYKVPGKEDTQEDSIYEQWEQWLGGSE